MKIHLGTYRPRYYKKNTDKHVTVVKFSKTTVWFGSSSGRVAYPRAKFELDFVEKEGD